MPKTITSVGIEKIGRRFADSMDHAAYTLNLSLIHIFLGLLAQLLAVLEGLSQHRAVDLSIGQGGVGLGGELLLKLLAPRLVVVFHGDEDGVGQLIHIAVLQEGADDGIPVSYTHLILTEKLSLLLDVEVGDTITLDGDSRVEVRAVSYTHLDVYKRQARTRAVRG